VSADFERLAERVAAELRRRVQTVHERVPCPACRAQTGERCIRRGTSWEDAPWAARLKHPHRERLRADGIAER
jgi:hypothetical protein